MFWHQDAQRKSSSQQFQKFAHVSAPHNDAAAGMAIMGRLTVSGPSETVSTTSGRRGGKTATIPAFGVDPHRARRFLEDA
ncbi:MAG: hypothetical protein ABI624_20940 [Casimicrobiaceae bacterium]